MNQDKMEAGQSQEFYETRYAPDRRKLRDTIFREVFDDYCGQGSWISTADYDRFIGWLDVRPDARVLDIACGEGGPTLRLSARTGCSVVGIDNNAHAVARATALAHEWELNDLVFFKHRDGSQLLPFSDGAFEALVCFDALCHLPNRPQIFAEWARVLKPGGWLLFTNQVLTGPISNAETAARTPLGYFLFVPDGYDEQQLSAASFQLVRRVDLTATFVHIAERHCAARVRHAEALRAVEGDEEVFEKENRYRAVAAQLARERRFSHFVFLARKPPRGAEGMVAS